MPNFLYNATELEFKYDPVVSTEEGRNVCNQHHIGHSFNFSILCPSGTAGLEVWVNNRKYYDQFVTEGYQVQLNQWDYATLTGRNINNVAFSSSWINITNDVVCRKGTSAFYIDQTFRFVRLQGSSLSGAATASPFGFMWSSNSENGR